jgi:2-polyprenyl-3-methyl-5-hydroxy-6-metoxy-1,4-benzoquinol methylase
VASYTDLDKEQSWKREREQFFRSIVELSARYVNLNERTNVLDFGCSYCHLLEEYAASGVNCYGIELDEKLRRKSANGRFYIYEALQELPAGLEFEIVTLIDSLYYVEDPYQILHEIGSRLTERGIIIIRVTNRRFLIDMLYRLFPHRVSNDIFGDGKYSFSHKNMAILFERAGFNVEELLLYERGKEKINDIKKRLIYRSTLFVSELCRIKITPGLIYVVRKGR